MKVVKRVFFKNISKESCKYKNGIRALVVSAVVMAGAQGALMAQEPGERELDRRVDVSREYLPDMDRAPKLTIAPVMSDTVALRPDLEYTINPSPWMTGFGVTAINPVRVDAASFQQLAPFYLKAGFGFPARSVVDIYGTTTSTAGSYAGGYLNHKGNWSKLRNEYNSKEHALESHNKAGIFGRTYLGRRIALSAEIGYDYDIYSLYNYSRTATSAEKSALVSYSVPRFSVGIGNDFTDLSSFNFAVGAEGYLLRARDNVKESGITAGVAVGKVFGIHRLKLDGKYDGAYGGGQRNGYNVSVLSITPSYLLDEGQFKIGASVDISYSKMKGESGKVYFLPNAEVLYSMANGAFVPYAQIESRLISNSFRSIVERNPYVVGDEAGFLHPSRDYKALAGIRGDITSNFSYELRAGVGLTKDVQNYIVDRYSTDNVSQYDEWPSGIRGYFTTVSAGKYKYLTVGASFSGRIGDSFNAGLELDYFKYSGDYSDNPNGTPEFTGKLYLGYNYRDKLFIKLKGELTGVRYFTYYTNLTGGGMMTVIDKKSAVFDLGIEAEYRLLKNLGVFISGENLLNQKLYPYYGYRGFGIGIIGGVKLLF